MKPLVYAMFVAGLLRDSILGPRLMVRMGMVQRYAVAMQ